MSVTMNVLLLGVSDRDMATLSEAMVDGRERIAVGRADHWSEVPRDASFALIVVGARAAEPGWEAFGQLLRREAPQATLVALPDAELDVHDGDWDDVVPIAERTPIVWRRVVHYGLRLHGMQDRLARWGLRDPLTNTLNRRGLERVLHQLTADRERGVGPLSVALIDVDDFKQVNDLLGMAGGDRVLRSVADAVRAQVREGDAVARVGGDEFLVLLPRARTWEAVEVAERIRLAIHEQVRFADGQPLSVSIGVRRITDDTHSLEALLTATQDGLRTSKESGKNQVHVSTTRSRAATSLSECSLPPGQPLMAFQDEVWTDPTGLARRVVRRPVLTPAEHLQLSMQRAVQAAWDLHWFGAGARLGPHKDHPTLSMHLRLFPPTLAQTAPDRILGYLNQRIAPQQLVVDLDEQFLSGDPSALLPTLEGLRDAGVRLCLSVSELGMGCLESLVVLRPDVVHLDGAIVRSGLRSRTRRTQLKRFIQSVDALELALAASGLTSEAEMRSARRLGFSLLGRADEVAAPGPPTMVPRAPRAPRGALRPDSP